MRGLLSLLFLVFQDVPSREFYHIRVPSNENKPVTNSRDTQDVSRKHRHSRIAPINADR